ncbi:MAG TPA: response regulator [Pyrinomonadaceae bacterium]|nr:response regulator [Pyrinomonadaceae bacterium]
MKITELRRKILFAEDDDAMRRFVEIVLRKENYEVTTVEDGLKAMQIAFQNEFDAIVADAVMPNMTGFDLCRMIRQNPNKKNVPFVILSGIEQDTTGEAENCLADVYLLKDENLKESLTKTLAEIFG